LRGSPSLVRRARPLGIGFLGHSSGLYEDLTAEENVAFHLRIRGKTGPIAREALDRLGLEGRLAGTQVSRLSAGQRRRVALAGLVAAAPQLWLLDEPHAGLDESARLTLDSLIAEAAAQGAAVVVASHELDHAARLATRRARIESGRLDAKLAATPAPAPEAESASSEPREVAPAPDDSREAGPGSPDSREVVDVA
jgi:ABC-type transport system involved in cytochrome c biogenesis ATPase subunit